MATTPATETIDRLVDFFPPHQQRQARQTLGGLLRGVVCQRLRRAGRRAGRVPAVEVLMVDATAWSTLIADPGAATAASSRLIAEGEYHGMQTFDQSLFQLFTRGLVGLARRAAAAATQARGPPHRRSRTSGMAMN